MKKYRNVTMKEYLHAFVYDNFYIALLFQKSRFSEKIFLSEYVEIIECDYKRRDVEATDEEREINNINNIIADESLKIEKLLLGRGW